MLAGLLTRKAQGWVVVLADPGAVSEAIRAGVGNFFEGMVSGKTDGMHGESIAVRGRVKAV